MVSRVGIEPTDSRNSVESLRRWKRNMLGIGARQAQRVVVVSRVGIEPTTHGLKVRCSTAELPAHGRKYTQSEGGSARADACVLKRYTTLQSTTKEDDSTCKSGWRT